MTKRKGDIENREDVELLVDTFYKKVIVDEKIGLFFTEVVKLDWEKHMPTMYDFWESTLLGTGNYRGNPMEKHISLTKKKKMESSHFERWLKLWESTVSELFAGSRSEEAVSRAKNIASLMEYNVSKVQN